MYISDKDELFCSKIDDAITLCLTRQKPYFLSFMSERKQSVAESYLNSVCFHDFAFFGGYENAERKMLGLFFDKIDNEQFPLSSLEFNYRKCDDLTHRDFLGALMSLGIEREIVGDILVGEGRCVVFVKSEMKDYIVSQLFKIGNVGVKISDANLSDLPQGRGCEELLCTVTSLRLDNIISAVTNLSREKTKQIILSGDVCVNFMQTQNISLTVKPNDTITIRRKGKFVLKGIIGKTKKDRFKISLIHFR